MKKDQLVTGGLAFAATLALAWGSAALAQGGPLTLSALNASDTVVSCRIGQKRESIVA